ncbi:LysR family transcriptional regulator [Bordetella bronchialis]|uniref:LysR family transcriptional regulator n=1 Tax=Bordetella bronchialis TaxID=463025 RepID=UPI0009F44AF0|nr:LysR family transcriptional regulator [Bordetella bronchialis]
MDKLRALEYFVAAANERSFTGAARALNVSVPAVARLVGALEQRLGVALFERTVQGLTLTADGVNYLAVCRPLMEQLDAADEALRGGALRPRGTLVLGTSPILSQHSILPALPAFHARHPDIHIDIRNIDRVTAPEASTAEVLVLYGWPKQPGMVHRHLADTRLLICAAPQYWEKHGVPVSPRDLAHHQCLLFRDHEGTVIDYWEHERDGQVEAVAVNGWLVSSHRDVILDAVIAGQGVARFTDLSIRDPLRMGLLVPVLTDWQTRQSPPINLLYRSNQRRLPRVRLFIEFLTDLFQRLEDERGPELAQQLAAEEPHWYRRRHSRASATPAAAARRASRAG